MAITRLSTYSVNQGLQKSDSFLVGQENASWFDSLASYKFTTDTTGNITFTNIPQTYTHLQLRIMHRDTQGGRWGDLLLYFNSDTGSNYSYHQILSAGSGSSVGGATSWTGSLIGRNSVNAATSDTYLFTALITDIVNYTNTNKFKTTRGWSGHISNGTGYGFIDFISTVWSNTAAITSIIVKPEVGFAAGSQIALYGVK